MGCRGLIAGRIPVLAVTGEPTAASAASFLPLLAASSSTDFQISVHEAGHCAGNILVGLPIGGTTIEFCNGYRGLTWSAAGGLQLDDGKSTAELCAELAPLMPAIGDNRAGVSLELSWAANEVIALLAGHAAERLFFTELLPDTEHDIVEARALVSLICRSPESIDAYMAFAAIETAALMAGHRDLVLAIGTELAARRTLAEAEINKIITNHSCPATVLIQPNAHR